MAILRGIDGEPNRIVRDCSGKLPCYRTRFDDVDIVFSDIGDLDCLRLPPLTVNWPYIATYICHPNLEIRDCGFRELTELMAGDSLELGRDGGTHSIVWDPREICRRGFTNKYSEAVDELRSTTATCIQLWAALYERIVHYLSGGFDSAVVLGCLARAARRPEITCITQYGTAAWDKETRYARLAAAMAGVPLIEQPRTRSNATLNVHTLTGQPSTKPTVSMMFRQFEGDACNEIARSLGANSTWSGQGGDHLFLQMQTLLSAADYVHDHGVNLGLVRAVRDAAHLVNQPYYFVLRNALRLRQPHIAWTSAAETDRQPFFVRAEALPADWQKYIAHPWAEGGEDLPRGKRYQLLLLADVLNRHRPKPDEGYVEEHHPLLSQPLMELCLRIPTYQLIRGGRDRALARDAFRMWIPAKITARLDKGETSAHVMDTIRRNSRFLIELLHDGVLAREGIIHLGAVDSLLADEHSVRVEHMWPLLGVVSAAMWLETNSNRLLRVAA